MKKLILILLVIAIPFAANAWTISWEYSETVDGFKLFYGPLSETPTELDVGNVKEYDLDSLNLTRGTRYEFFLKAYVGENANNESDHIRWTYPAEPQIVEMPEQTKVIINIY